jgi:hypothetical protein
MAPIIINIENILGICRVFEINFSKSIFDITKLKTTNVKAKPKQYNKIFITA